MSIAILTRYYLLLGLSLVTTATGVAQQRQLDRFSLQQLTSEYYSEGAGVGDLDNDGDLDVVYGPHWYEAPDYQVRHTIYEPKPQNREGYADHFFAWLYDFNADGWRDVFVVGFPGTPAFVYENPGKNRDAGPWKKHQVFDWVSNESPQLIQIVGDERPELVCTRDGFFGYATIDWEKPFSSWKFHAISAQIADKRFGHGLGIGDINGDGRQDVIHPGGWLEQPESLSDSKPWKSHEVAFSNAYGGAEMYAYDVDGDGDSDVITSLAAHDFGLAWYEQVPSDDASNPTFQRRDIMGSKPKDNPYGLVFSELHSVNLADIDGDGLKDIVTGKTYYSHHKGSPMWDAGAVVYWFKLVRSADQGVQWIPYQAAADCGIGRQLGIHDIDNDGLLDMVVGGMKGAHVLKHSRSTVSDEQWRGAQPKLRDPSEDLAGVPGQVGEIFEGESMKVLKLTGGTAIPQGMAGFPADHWSSDSQIWWTGGKPGDRLDLEFAVKSAGAYDIYLALTKARDYASVQIDIDGEKLGDAIDLFHSPDVISTGLKNWGRRELAEGKHRLGFEIVGANPAAVQAYMVGIDVLQLGQSAGELPKNVQGKPLNLDFESGTLADWKAEGNAFQDQPIKGDTVNARRKDMSSHHQGEYWIGTYETAGDTVTGTLTSATFVVTQPFASFLVGGGDSNETKVELVDASTGKPFYRATGRVSEDMRPVVVDLSKYQGKEIAIRLTDQSRNGWGHINFDNFRLHRQAPGPVSPADAVLVADEYPHQGLAADQAAKAMAVPDGFSVIASAAEPDILQPIAMALDDRGRVWVAEAYEYPRRAEGEKGRDRILIFEDQDGDGKLESRKVFAEGLNLVSGLEVGFGGVWIGAAPYLLFIADQNGDDRADGPPQILLDGWGYQDTHETLNAFIWGPDGWLYGCHGVFTHSLVGKPGDPEEKRQPINAGIWRYHPTRHVFEVFAHGTSNPWGVDFNDRGQAFITACVIPHLYHIIQGARYERQAGQHFNPYTYDDIKTIADHRHYLGNNPHGGNGRSDAAGGGHAHAGAMFYLGDRWPEEYRDKLFMNNIHGQRLNVDVPSPKGSGYVGSHAPDFLLTGDMASQILNFRYGPDGQAYMIDWYDMQACHLTEPGKHDRSNGRIYKIVYGKSDPVKVDLDQASDDQLVQYQLHSNDWYVRHSRRILQERASSGQVDSKALENLKQMATTHADETRRLRAAWCLSCIDALDTTACDQLLKDASPYVRGWAIQLARQSSKPIATLTSKRMAELAKSDPSPIVRLYLASAAQSLPPADRWDVLAQLLAHGEDAKDHNLPLMLWYAAEPLADIDPQRAMALALAHGKSFPSIRQYMLRRIGAGSPKESLATLVQGLSQADTSEVQLVFLDALRTSLAGQRQAEPPKSWSSIYGRLAKSENSEVRIQAQSLGVTFGDEAALKEIRQIVADVSKPVDSRVQALNSLLGAKDSKLVPSLLGLLRDPGMRSAALSGLAQYNDPKIGSAILEIYPQLSSTEKRTALSTLASRADNALAMLRAIEGKKIPPADLSADLVRQLQFLKNDEVIRLLESTWGTARETPAEKAKLIDEYKELVQSNKAPKPDLSLGRAIFAKTCQQCHILFGAGSQIGPELTGSNRANLDYLLSNIVDPSAVMAKEYQPTIILTDDARVLTGIVRSEDDRSITLQTADKLEIIPKDEIDKRQLSEKSMMPEDQLRPFSPLEVRSLLAYLAHDRQVPILATPTTTSMLFNGKDLTLWKGNESLWSVDQGQIIGKSNGLDHNEFLVSDLAMTDFRLTFEVQLVKNEGNSGVQFRSEPLEHGVRGYQADIGAGWWGKLYEEEGRALLWDQSGEAHVKPGQWNQYEIMAVGSHIQTRINGQLCVDLDDPKGAKRGIIALQLHSGGPTEVRFKNFQLEVIGK